MDPTIRAALRAKPRSTHDDPAKPTPEDERRARVAIIREARAHGAVLTNPTQRGGLPASLVLGVMRRDEYRCKVHGDRGEGENGGLQVHHKGKLKAEVSAWLGRKGGSNDPNNLVTLCKRAHDGIHDKDRALADEQAREGETPDEVADAAEDHEGPTPGA